MSMTKNAYDLALSFAGEDRPYVSRVARLLRDRGISVFYDDDEQSALWGKNLYTYLREIYRDHARFTIIFCSKHYAGKHWTNHERESAQERALKESYEYILPARFDDTEIPGLPSTIGYLDLRKLSEEGLVEIVVAKLAREKSSETVKRPKSERRLDKSRIYQGSQVDRDLPFSVLILAHAGMARELASAVEVIAGRLPRNFAAVSIDWNDTFEEAVDVVRSAARIVDTGQGFLIVTDMYGGTPSHVAAYIGREFDSVTVVSGVNLPMVLRLAVSGPLHSSNVDEFAAWLQQKAQRGITVNKYGTPDPKSGSA